MKRTALTLALILALFSALIVQKVVAVENSWETMAAMPTARSVLGVAVVDGKIYAIGGYNGKSYLGTNEVYDPTTNTWETKTPMPTPRINFGIAVFQNKIYCIGGGTPVKSDGYVTSVNEVYDTATDTWENRTSMPNPRSNLEANSVGDKIYLIGGQGRGDPRMFIVKNYTSLNEVYDPATDSWITETPIPNATANYASAVFDDKIYVIGSEGRSISGILYLNQVYDTKTDMWSLAAPVPGTILNLAVAGATTGANAPKLIYVIGGYYGKTADFDKPWNYTNQVYNPKNDSWSFADYIPVEEIHYAVAVVDDMLYAVGGASDNNTIPYAYNLRYTPIGYGIPDTSTPSPPESQQTEPFPTILVITFTALVIVMGVALLDYFKKRKHYG
jgi:N-acetylneuraminic acid mutarotase